MVVYGIETERCPEVLQFWADTLRRSEAADPVRNPFRNQLLKYSATDEGVTAFHRLEPVYVNPSWFGLVGAVALFAVRIIFNLQPNLWLVLGMGFCFLLTMIGLAMATGRFYAVGAKMGLRKAGYKGKVRILTGAALESRLLEAAI